MAEFLDAVTGIKNAFNTLRNKKKEEEEFKNVENFNTSSTFGISSLVVLIVAMTVAYNRKENRAIHMVFALFAPSLYLLWAMFIGKVLHYNTVNQAVAQVATTVPKA
jgi:hypothetical protein